MMKNASVCALLCLGWSSTALAYSEPSAFLDDALLGGGQGRMFTGSPNDGFTCKVCHGGGPKLDLAIQSFPSAYSPNQTYEMSVSFSGPPPQHAGATLEITDANGNPAGTLSLPPPELLTPADECSDFPVPAVSIEMPDPDGQRQVLALAACGAQRILFQWTAPAIPMGPLRFTGGVVNGDGAITQTNPEIESDLVGDGVTLISRRMLPVGTTAVGDVVEGGCTLTTRPGQAADDGPAAGVGAWRLALLGIAGWLLSRRRRRQR